MAPLVNLLKESPGIESKVCVTGQHREMLDQVLKLFNIVPDYDLAIMKAGQDLYDVTTSILLNIKPVLRDFKPDVVLVHGDTSTTFAAALACYYEKTAVGHVEAGLRTGNIYSPWPEEANRKLTGAITRFHFAPTATSEQNLLNEQVNPAHIVVTGNTVIDALLQVVAKIDQDNALQASFAARFPYGQNGRQLILVTGHRRESFGAGFDNICAALKQLAADFPDCDIVYPVHLNPSVQEPVNRLLGDFADSPVVSIGGNPDQLSGGLGVFFALLIWMLVIGYVLVAAAMVEVIIWERTYGTVDIKVVVPLPHPHLRRRAAARESKSDKAS